MPALRLRSASGHGSPSIHENIDVAAPAQDVPGEPRRKRIKLKFTHSSSSNPDRPPEPAVTRPKRQSVGRVRYDDDIAHVNLKSTTAKSSARKTMLSDSTLLSTPRSDLSSLDQTTYGADFLANFIEQDTTPTPAAARKSKITLKPGRKSDKAGNRNAKSTKQIVAVSSDDHSTLDFDTSPTQGQQIDSPETIIRKLRVACHALDTLNISTGQPLSELPILPPRQGNWYPPYGLHTSIDK